MAPVNQGAQGLMAFQNGAGCRPRAGGKHLSSRLRYLLHTQRVDAGGGQFEGERNAVQPAADLCHGGQVGRRHGELRMRADAARSANRRRLA